MDGGWQIVNDGGWREFRCDESSADFHVGDGGFQTENKRQIYIEQLHSVWIELCWNKNDIRMRIDGCKSPVLCSEYPTHNNWKSIFFIWCTWCEMRFSNIHTVEMEFNTVDAMKQFYIFISDREWKTWQPITVNSFFLILFFFVISICSNAWHVS